MKQSKHRASSVLFLCTVAQFEICKFTNRLHVLENRNTSDSGFPARLVLTVRRSLWGSHIENTDVRLLEDSQTNTKRRT